MTKNKLSLECIPILASIFVKWKWMVTSVLIFVVAFGAFSYQHGKKIQEQDSKIHYNKEAIERIDKTLLRLDLKMDTIIIMLRKEKEEGK